MAKWKRVKIDQSEFGSSFEDAAVCFQIHELVEGDLEDLIYNTSSDSKKVKRKNSTRECELDEHDHYEENVVASETETLKHAKVKTTKRKSKNSADAAAGTEINEGIKVVESETGSIKSAKRSKRNKKTESSKVATQNIENVDVAAETVVSTRKRKKTKNKFSTIVLKANGDTVSRISEQNEKTEKTQVSSEKPEVAEEATSKNIKIDWTGVEQQLKQNIEELASKGTETQFSDEEWINICGVPDGVMQSLAQLQFKKPTEIQKRVLPIAMDGKYDVIAAAETGSGKTLAYVIPAVRRILDDRKRNTFLKGPKVLILVPTRELAIQVSQHVKALSANVIPKINHVTIVGGLTAHKQKRVLMKKNPEIIIATPGRLWQLMGEDDIRHLRSLSQIKSLILDEADRLCEAGHFKDLQSVLNFVYSPIENGSEEETELNENEKTFPAKKISLRQTMILSATLTVANQHLTEKAVESKTSQEIQTGAIAPILKKVILRKNFKVVDVTRSTVTAENLVEQKIFCPADEKDLYLYYCLTALPKGRKLVFANSIDHIRRLNSLFTLLQFETKVLHAHIQQRQRLKNLEKFSTSDDCTLFCTDVAARGLDIRNVNHVIHYHLPKTYETYVHRSGRTARSGCGGISIMLMAPNEASLFVKIVNALNKEESDIGHANIDYNLVKNLRTKMQLAQSIEKIEHKNRKVSRESAWAAGVARDLEVEFDDSENKYCQHERSDELGRMKNSLKKMLQVGVKTSSAGVKMKNPVLYLQ